MNLTFFVLKWEKMWKKQQLSQHQICRQNIRHQKFIWEHHIWCHVKISEVATLVSMIPNFWCSLTAPRPRSAVLENFAAYQPRRVTFKCVSRASAAYRVDVHLMMNLWDFSKVIVLDNNSYSSCLSYSFYLRFRDASGRGFVARILLLVFLQVACCSHCSNALACELLIQNSGQLTGMHLSRKMLSEV